MRRRQAAPGATAKDGVLAPPIRILEVDLDQEWAGATGTWDDNANWAQVLFRLHGCPVGLVLAPLPPDGFSASALQEVTGAAVADAVGAHRSRDRELAEAREHSDDVAEPPCKREHDEISASGPSLDVVVPTRNRPELLERCVDSILSTGYKNLRVIVVDNDPSGPETADRVARRVDWGPRVDYVKVMRAGSSLARNRGIGNATAEIIAFVDDDIVVDPGWAASLVLAFLREPHAGCVTGAIIAAELNTHAQVWIEEYGGFSKGFLRRVYDPLDRPPNLPLYPYAAGTYGSGANMAFRREALNDIQGFDPALGLGTTSRGGEDLAAFAAVLLNGWRLVYEPSVMVKHWHHGEYAALRRVIFGYGLGLGAYLAKTVCDRPSTFFDMVRRAPPGLAYLLSRKSPKNTRKRADYPRELTARELTGLAMGPFAYAMARVKLRRQARTVGAAFRPGKPT